MASLYEAIGGETAVRATVLKMYEKVLDDPELAPFFESIDVEALRRSQTAFVTFAFGGPNHYTGQNLRTAHKNAVSQGMDDRHFDRVAAHLKASMEELSVPADLILQALAIVETTRNDVMGR